MAATGFTPISLYYSATASAVPLAANLTGGELALNTNDGKLYYKTSAGVVSLLASNAATTNVSSISFGSTGLTPATATTGAVTVAGTLVVGNGGTGLTSLTAGRIPFGAGTSAFNNSSNLFYDSANIRLGIGTSTPAVSLAVSATDAILAPVGTTAQRPTGATGYIRYNSTLAQFEGYGASAWGAIGGGATGGGGEQVFWENETSIDSSYTITAGKNAGTFGPITIAAGVTVTVPSGSVWSIV
jgi:hypothetical protein